MFDTHKIHGIFIVCQVGNPIHRKINKTKDKLVSASRKDNVNENFVRDKPSICTQVCLLRGSFTQS